MKPSIADFLLFKIDQADFGVWRPFLVTHVNDDGSVEGELFLNWERDRRAEWPSKHLFWGLDPQRRTCEVRNVKQGDAVGNYALPLPAGTIHGLSHAFTDMFARLRALEDWKAAHDEKEANRGKLVQPTPPRPIVPEKRSK